MKKLSELEPKRVFEYFEEICSIPRGSGNMGPISQYCLDFAKGHGLRAVRDAANNVVIYKNGTAGYEAAAPVILQGHLDMVCQKTDACNIDFEKDGIRPYVDGDFVTADGTTLGADNGIAVAMALAILASDDIAHPPLEVLLTTDEETGMYGAAAVDGSLFQSKRLINIDSEEQDKLTVSCAGGSEFEMHIPFARKKTEGTKVSIVISGLKGGHSGIEIDKGRINAAVLAGRILCGLSEVEIISLTGGDKSNAITKSCKIEIVAKNIEKVMAQMQTVYKTVKAEISDIEPAFELQAEVGGKGEFETVGEAVSETLIFALLFLPNGVQAMSATIEGLVETSLNLGILKTNKDSVTMVSALRSNKLSALMYLEKRLTRFAKMLGAQVKTAGHYPPWEYKEDSALQEAYKKCFKEKFGYLPTVSAIHAGLECGIFAKKIPGLDAISIGPELSDVHTVGEKLKISSVQEMFELICDMLAEMK